MQYPNFPNDCHSLLCQYLTPECFEQLRHLKTQRGFTLEDLIRSGVKNPDSSIGVYAPDAQSYTLFSPLLDPIIEAYHGFSSTDHHQSDLNPDALPSMDLDPTGTYIRSTRIRVGRNLADFPLGAGVSRDERKEIEELITAALAQLQGDLAGDYYPLYNMDPSDQQRLIEAHFLFREGDRFLEAAGLNRDWPKSRGIFHNPNRDFLVWVNEEDQLRIISMEKGGNVGSVFRRLVRAVKSLERSLTFLKSDHLGYISSCPSNLGTAMRASVHILLPQLAKDREQFEAIAQAHHLQIRGKDGEHTQSSEPIFDVSNRRRLGISEVQAVSDMMYGVAALIKAEQSLASKS